MTRPKTLALRGRVAQRDGGVCIDCPPGTPPWPWEEWEADHEVELVDGGTDDLDNLVTRCKPHHRQKTNARRAEKGRPGGRPNKGRKLISVWVAESGIQHLDQLAAEFGVSRSDLIRDALKAGLPVVERQLKRGEQ